MDALASQAMKLASQKGSRRELFERFWKLTHDEPMYDPPPLIARTAIPYMDEPWYC
jgi:hypothetical protein